MRINAPAGAIIILGAPNNPDGNLSSIAVERAEQALREYAAHPDFRFVLTGGRGAHFNTAEHPHWHYVRRYLTARGVPASAFLEAAESASTIEDAALSRPILDRHGISRVIVVTSDFHLPRARFLFERENPGREITFSGSMTHLPEEEMVRLRVHEERALAKLNGIDP